MPDKSWNLEKLESYALDRANEIHGFGRKTITQTYLFGSALSLIRDLKKQNKTWVDWVKTQDFSLTTATNAIKLAERATFDELQSFQGMTPTDLKAALDIIKAPAPKRRNQSPSQVAPDQPTEAALKLHKAETGSTDQGASDQTDGDPSEQAKAESTGTAPEAADRKVTMTRESTNGRKLNEPVVGSTLTPAEVLGQALNLLIVAKGLGVTADCSDILSQIGAFVADLSQSVPTVVSA